jgi:hypothetical protein
MMDKTLELSAEDLCALQKAFDRTTRLARAFFGVRDACVTPGGLSDAAVWCSPIRYG